MSCPVLYRLVLILRVAFYLFPDAINKSPEVAKVLVEKFLKLRPGHWHGSVVTLFVLKSLLGDQPTQKQTCKWNFVWFFSTGSLKMSFALLAKLIAIYIQITIIKVWEHREIFLPGLSGSEWIRSTDPVDCMFPSPGQI